MDTRAPGSPAPATWAEQLREPPFHVLRAWTEADAHPAAPDWVEGPREVWSWLASVLPDTLRVDTAGERTVIGFGSIELLLVPEPDAALAAAGWPDGSRLALRAPSVSAVVLPDDDEPGWVLSRSDDPAEPTLVALAPTVPTFHRELAHRVWHRAVDLLMEAGDSPVDPGTVTAAIQHDLTTALARGWRTQLPWVPAIVEGHSEWRAELAGVPTGSWLDAGELPHPYRVEGGGSVVRAVALT